MGDAPDFLSSAHDQVIAARLLGAVFNSDGTWEMNPGQKPLPSGLTDRLRVHRRAIAKLQETDASAPPPNPTREIKPL